MIEKIFTKLKQDYSHLGLGDAILRSHAEALGAIGLVTEENIDAVVGGQKGFLEGLQKSNDARVTEAVKKARKEAETEARKAEEEAERRRKEELERSAEIPAWFKEDLAKREASAKAERDAYEARIAELIASSNANKDAMDKQFKALVSKMESEAKAAQAAQARKERSEMILKKAKDLGISQSRIDEGFAIADDATEDAIGTYLEKVATNAKAQEMPSAMKFTMTDAKPSEADFKNLASLLVK